MAQQTKGITYEHQITPVSPLADHCVGVRQPSQRERELYAGIDREIERLKLGESIGHFAWRFRS